MNPIIDPTGNIPAPLEAAITSMTGGVLAGLAGANPLGAMTAAQNETLNNWAAHIGIHGSFSIPGTPVSYSFGGGVVVDDQGNWGTYTSKPDSIIPGLGVGGDASLGISIGAYPSASNIKDYGGAFNNGSIGGGAGAYGSLDVFQDPSKGFTSPKDYGVGATFGFGFGAGASATRTDTTVVPRGNLLPAGGTSK